MGNLPSLSAEEAGPPGTDSGTEAKGISRRLQVGAAAATEEEAAAALAALEEEEDDDEALLPFPGPC